MSYRARRIVGAAVAPYPWESLGAIEDVPAVVVERAPVVSADPPMPPIAEQQARLAAMERDAFTKGYAQGERAGAEAGTKRAEAMLRRLAQTLEDLGQLRATIIRETERQMAQLALALARRVVQRELTLDPDLVAALAHVALGRLGERAPATIRLHPDDFAAVASQRSDAWAGSQVSVVPDPNVSRGGCLVESEFGIVDGSLDSQFRELSRALFGDGDAAETSVVDDHAA